MIFSVRVVPRAGRNLVKEEKAGLKVYLVKPAQDGLANQALIGILAEYLGLKKYRIKIKQGLKSRNKIIEVESH